MVRKHHWRKLDTEDSGHCVEREGLSGPGSSWLWAHIPQGGGHPAPYSLTAPGEPSFPLLQGNSTPTCTPELQSYLGLHETTWTSSFSHVMKQGIKFSFSAQASLIRFYSEMTNCLGLWKYLIIFAWDWTWDWKQVYFLVSESSCHTSFVTLDLVLFFSKILLSDCFHTNISLQEKYIFITVTWNNTGKVNLIILVYFNLDFFQLYLDVH